MESYSTHVVYAVSNTFLSFPYRSAIFSQLCVFRMKTGLQDVRSNQPKTITQIKLSDVTRHFLTIQSENIKNQKFHSRLPTRNKFRSHELSVQNCHKGARKRSASPLREFVGISNPFRTRISFFRLIKTEPPNSFTPTGIRISKYLSPSVFSAHVKVLLAKNVSQQRDPATSPEH